MNVVNSGALVGCQTCFDSVWIYLVWGQKGKPLGSGAHPTYKKLSQCLETKHIPVLCKRGPSPRQPLQKFQRCSWLAYEGSSIALFPTPVQCRCPLAGVGAGARGPPAPWLTHNCVWRVLSSGGMMLAIGHMQTCSAWDLLLHKLKVSINLISMPLWAILKVKEIFFPMFPYIRLGKLSKLSTPQWVDVLFVAKWVSIKWWIHEMKYWGSSHCIARTMGDP